MLPEREDRVELIVMELFNKTQVLVLFPGGGIHYFHMVSGAQIML